MGCCGEPRSKTLPPPPPQGNNAGQGAIYPPSYPTNTQPSPHPGLQYPDPSKTPHPPNGYTNGNGTMHGQMPSVHQMQTLNGHPHVVPTNPPPNDFGPTGYPPGPQPTMGHQGPPQNNFGPMLDPTIQRPTPIHPPQRSTTVSPPLAMGTPGPFTGPGSMTSSTPSGAGGSTFDDGKLSISVDFGTTMSGIAYGSSRINAGRVQNIIHWPGSFETFRKVPTCLLYDSNGRVLAWGLEAKNAGPMPGTIRCEWFKLFLEPRALRDPTTIDPRLPLLPPNKTATDLIIDYLSCLYEYAKEQITRETGAVSDLNAADVWLTVPAAWDAAGCDLMREAAIKAGLVQSAHAGDRNWRDRLRIITEPEAAAVHCAHLTDLHKLKPSQNFLICDAGGGTVDLAIYKLIGSLSNLEIAEVCARSGANCGSIFLDLRFRELVRTLLADHPAHLDPASQAFFMHAFAESDKLAYNGEEDDENYFHFNCFNVEDPDDPSVGLVNGELAIPGILLRREVFDPVIEEVLNLLEEQIKRAAAPIDALMMVGGFSESHYLFKRVEDRFKGRIGVLARPNDADTATSRGAAQYGLARRPLVSSVIAGRSYLMKVKLPAEPEDWQKRPAYIRENDAGISIYRIFVAVLFTSDVDKTMRYTDEGAIEELCKWSVDLGMLPTFQMHANMPHPNGFYTDFELGLELDSAGE
ncbi:hypothetical protein M407DRAFT_20531 [Tulasnella calospora MUT 4182]|uniref:Actin-like ATPase domain-containing protein n=1 Tax=Tulasnella calospora MUT 4182 TaxID=1051891 RepID=A0A0C3QG11_9AGAM|nr:hypothetical protein M407DRAFT_20531 [Tulasnella calospora MUT 4182]